MKRNVVLATAGFALLLAIFLLWPSETRKVEKRIHQVANAMEKEQILALAGYIARDYADDNGRSYEEILGAAKLVFDQFEAIDVDFLQLKAQVNGNYASAFVRARLTASSASGRSLASFLNQDRDEMDFRITLKKTSDGWRIDSVKEESAP